MKSCSGPGGLIRRDVSYMAMGQNPNRLAPSEHPIQSTTKIASKLGGASPKWDLKTASPTKIGNLKWALNSPTNQNGIPLVLNHGYISNSKAWLLLTPLEKVQLFLGFSGKNV